METTLMYQLSQHEATETFELEQYNVLRNSILCSISRYDEFKAAASEIWALREYTVICNASVSHNTMYLADSEGIIHTFEVKDDETCFIKH